MLEYKDVYYVLTGNKYYDTTKQVSFVEIQCDCGNVKYKRLSDLKVVRTCGNGCPISSELKSIAVANSDYQRPLIEKGLSGMSRIYDLYKRRAKKKGFTFNLSKEEFKKLTSSNCYYCNEKSSMLYRHKQTKTSDRERENSEYWYNSLDRINSALGYTVENIRPSCKCCNTMKWDHEEDFFKERIKIFYEFYFKEIDTPDGDFYEDHY